MSIRHENGELAETGVDANLAIGVAGSTDFDARGSPVVGQYFSLGEAQKTLDEFIRSAGGEIDAVFRDGLKRRVGGWRRVPVQLHVDATGPLDHGVAADRIREGSDNHIGTSGLG